MFLFLYKNNALKNNNNDDDSNKLPFQSYPTMLSDLYG